jgi:hypothetical protein
MEEEPCRPFPFNNRFVTDPGFSLDPFHSDPCNSEDMKKRSKLDLIKSKLSFKDLRKEASIENIHSSPLTPQFPDVPAQALDESSDRAYRRIASPNTLPAMSRPNYNFKVKLKPIDQGRVSGCSSQSSTAPSKIPLPPPGAFTNAHGISVPSRILNRRVSSTESQSSSITQDRSKSSEIDTAATPTTKRRPKNLTLLPPGVDIAQKPRVSCEMPNYATTMESPSMLVDLLEGPDKVKHLPRNRLGPDFGLSVPPKEKLPTPTAYKENEPHVTSITDYLPSFDQRLEKADLPLEGFTFPTRSIPMQVDDLVDMVRSIQRQTDLGVNNLNNKLDELANWINDQLQKQVTSISDLARTKADLSSKQLDVSKEIMKFQMECRLEVGVMERRLNTFEMKVMDEAQAEIRALGRSYEDLNRKTENLINKFSSDDIHKFIECQRRKTEEIQREVAYLKSQDEMYKLAEPQKKQTVRCVKAQMDDTELTPTSPYPITPSKVELSDELPAVQAELGASADQKVATLHSSMDVQRYSESTVRSTPPLIMENERDRALPLPPTPASLNTPPPLQSRVSSAQGQKPVCSLPRSISLTNKGFMPSTKGTVSNAPDSNEKQVEKKPLNEGKKRSIFAFLHRRDHRENGSERHSRSSLRRAEGTLLLDDGSSRNSTPTPPIPAILRDISKSAQREDQMISSVHPALRAATVQNVVHEDEVLSFPRGRKPIISPQQPHSNFKDEAGSNSSPHGSSPSTRTTDSSFGESKVRSAADSFHSAMQEATSKPTKRNPYLADDEHLHVPLLGHADHGWDQDPVSLRHHRSNDTLH